MDERTKIDASSFTPLPASAEDVRELARRLDILEHRIEEQDERQVGTTAWLIREVRTIALMTPNEGIKTLNIILHMYDKAQDKAARREWRDRRG